MSSVTSSRYTYEGTETTNTTTTRTGGFTDLTGQAQSRKIVANTNAQWLRPFKAEPYVAWNGAVNTPVVVAVYGVVNGASVPNDDDIWFEAVYLGDTGTPASSITSYSNPNGQGNRTTTIVLTTNLSGSGSPLALINGSEANEYWWSNGLTNGTIVFDFGVGASRIINEFTWTQDNANTHGAAQTFAGSNDNITYTNLSTTIALGTTATDVFSFANTTGYRYYRLSIPGPTSSGPYLREIKFKIDAPAIPAATKGTVVTTTKVNVLANGSPVASDSSTWSASGILPATWDAATVTNATLSNGNLSVTNTGTTSSDQGAHVVSSGGQNTGKYYFEITNTSISGAGANRGFGIGTLTSTHISIGDSATVGTIVYSSGNIWSNGVNTGFNAGSAIGTTPNLIVGIAVDLDSRKMWFKVLTPSAGNWNGDPTHDPTTSAGGVSVPSGVMVPFATFGGTGCVAGNIRTANFGASAFFGAVPSGFTSGWPMGSAIWTPFKIVTTLNSPSPSFAGYIDVRVRVAKPDTVYYIDPQVGLLPGTLAMGTTSDNTASRYTYEGTETSTLTVIRTNGAADPTGNRHARRIATTANTQWLRPFKAIPMAQWSSTIGAVAMTVYGAALSGTLPLNDEVWMELEYLGDSSSPLGSFTTTTKANVLASGTAVTADTSTWNDNAPLRSNSTVYKVGDAIKVASNPTRAFVCVDAGTSAATEPVTVSPVLWSTTDISNMTISGAGLIASTSFVVNSACRATGGKGDGKFYFENTWTGVGMDYLNGNNSGVGLCIKNVPIVGSSPPSVNGNATGACMYWSRGQIAFNGTTIGGIDLGGCVVGSIVCAAVDTQNKRIWFKRDTGYWNGNAYADPALNIGGVDVSAVFKDVSYFPVVTPSGAGGQTNATINFGASAFTYAVPSGFSAGPASQPGYASAVDGSMVTDGTATFVALNRFKLTKTLNSPPPAQAGYIHARVRAARASTTYYIDPKIELI